MSRFLVSSVTAGFIHLVSSDGSYRLFARGIGQCQGMVMVGDTLWVASFNKGMYTISSDGTVSRPTLTGEPIGMNPYELEVGPNGEIYVTCYAAGVGGKGSLQVISPEGVVRTVARGLSAPGGICWYKGALYMTGYASSQAGLWRFTPDDEKLAVVHPGCRTLPWGICVMNDQLYVGHYDGNVNGGRRIARYDLETKKFITFATNVLLDSIMGIAAPEDDESQSIFAAVMDTGKIYQCRSGSRIKEFATGLDYPTGLINCPEGWGE